jgi:fatty acid desaturase
LALIGSRPLGVYDLPDRHVPFRSKMHALPRKEVQWEIPGDRGPFEHQAIHHVLGGTTLEDDQCHAFASFGIFRLNESVPYKSYHKFQSNLFCLNLVWFARSWIIDAVAPIGCTSQVSFYLKIGLYHRVFLRLIGAVVQSIALYFCCLLPAYYHFSSFLSARIFLHLIGDFLCFFYCQHRWELTNPEHECRLDWGAYHAKLSVSLWGQYFLWHPLFWGYGQGTSPSTLSYHLEHTLFPGINYSYLQLIAPVCEQLCQEHDIEYYKYTSLVQIVQKIRDDLTRGSYQIGSLPMDKKVN